jgi:hypothetical protein
MKSRKVSLGNQITQTVATAGPVTIAAMVEWAVGGGTGIATGAVTEVLSAVFIGRHLSKLEERRVDLVLQSAKKKLETYETLNYPTKAPGFFLDDEGYSSDEAEVFEAVLKAAVDDQEQRKAPLLGFLLASIARGRNASKIERSDANRLISMVRTLSYRQLCLISIVVSDRRANNENRFHIRYDPNGNEVPLSSLMAFAELRDLQTLGYVGISGGGADAAYLVTVKELASILFDEADLFEINQADLTQQRDSLRTLAESLAPER